MSNEPKQFTMSMYANKEALYKAKSEYYVTLAEQQANRIEELEHHISQLAEALHQVNNIAGYIPQDRAILKVCDQALSTPISQQYIKEQRERDEVVEAAIKWRWDEPNSHSGYESQLIDAVDNLQSCEHNTNSEECWCNPRIIAQDNGSKVIVHNLKEIEKGN